MHSRHSRQSRAAHVLVASFPSPRYKIPPVFCKEDVCPVAVIQPVLAAVRRLRPDPGLHKILLFDHAVVGPLKFELYLTLFVGKYCSSWYAPAYHVGWTRMSPLLMARLIGASKNACELVSPKSAIVDRELLSDLSGSSSRESLKGV
ncbi:MAG: hypothetical protein AB1351_06720 [Thermoproteota archaeon]